MYQSKFLSQKRKYHKEIYRFHALQNQPVTISQGGLKLFVDPGVFNPEYASSSYLLAKLTRQIRNSRVLDLGCGCGIQGLIAAASGNKVVLSDISQAAVSCCHKNVQLLGLDRLATVMRGDGLQAIEGPFDYILLNPPFFSGKPRDELDALFCDEDYRFLTETLQQAYHCLTPQGSILLVFSNLIPTSSWFT